MTWHIRVPLRRAELTARPAIAGSATAASSGNAGSAPFAGVRNARTAPQRMRPTVSQPARTMATTPWRPATSLRLMLMATPLSTTCLPNGLHALHREHASTCPAFCVDAYRRSWPMQCKLPPTRAGSANKSRSAVGFQPGRPTQTSCENTATSGRSQVCFYGCQKQRTAASQAERVRSLD